MTRLAAKYNRRLPGLYNRRRLSVRKGTFLGPRGRCCDGKVLFKSTGRRQLAQTTPCGGQHNRRETRRRTIGHFAARRHLKLRRPGQRRRGRSGSFIRCPEQANLSDNAYKQRRRQSARAGRDLRPAVVTTPKHVSLVNTLHTRRLVGQSTATVSAFTSPSAAAIRHPPVLTISAPRPMPRTGQSSSDLHV